ncbi:hypothetical protein KP509_36G049000 [Ceratopteris richardii]|uniref:Uncharacterized protein n=1 Tax=Ceratopteris richardii TaxID=49495 RepID=A0A8T2QCY2_CERRI|nr:hypothetical protein KP509_36G049000 [Ceratopteris richardii]
MNSGKMSSELSEAREKQLLHTIREVSSDFGAQREECRKADTPDKDEADKEEQNGEKKGVLQAVGDLVSLSAHSLKEVVLGESNHKDDHGATAPKEDEGGKDSAEESLLVHTAVHD